MRRLRQHLPLATWLAWIAALALALAPTVSRALAFSLGESAWTEVCTPLGLKLEAVADTREPAPSAAHLGQIGPCAYCALSAGAAPLPAAGAPGVPVGMAPATLPRGDLKARRVLEAWPRAQPRAPPLRS